ncbi:MAG: Co2+/Mg2+ efflux protein ApaG [Alphaproteobacteria bacterium GM202ARS2]|nr:Co2+/Mg2+ efflux protein ApaG [Alphaproteobacteria bacterium GM202ARS2]
MNYSKETQSIKVTVHPVYLEEQSEPERGYYVWAYHVRIENKREDSVKLISRCWNITDANGTVKEVKGAGVIGEQPVLGPGDVFEYTSGAPLPTCSGFMLGSYQMVSENGKRFSIEVPGFSLDIPDPLRVVN